MEIDLLAVLRELRDSPALHWDLGMDKKSTLIILMPRDNDTNDKRK